MPPEGVSFTLGTNQCKIIMFPFTRLLFLHYSCRSPSDPSYFSFSFILITICYLFQSVPMLCQKDWRDTCHLHWKLWSKELKIFWKGYMQLLERWWSVMKSRLSIVLYFNTGAQRYCSLLSSPWICPTCRCFWDLTHIFQSDWENNKICFWSVHSWIRFTAWMRKWERKSRTGHNFVFMLKN